MKKILVFSSLLMVLFASCKKESETPDPIKISDYYPLAPGKYIAYNLDSTVYTNFGKQKEIISYQVKDVVDAEITDNLGRPAYRIIRYIRKNTSASWLPSNTFVATPLGRTLEFTENNLRFIKLALPIKNEFSWRGNSFIDTYNTESDLRYLDHWDYIYDSVGMPASINTLSFENTIKVFHKEEEIGDPSIAGTSYAEKTFSMEKYAKGVGLIYKEFIHWEYQGNTQTYSGYGIKLTIFEYN